MKTCNMEPNEGKDFTAEFIDKLDDYILVYTENGEELTVNLDDFPSEKKFYFLNETKLTIQTNDWNPNYYGESHIKGEIYADESDVIIDNINQSVSENLFVFQGLSFKTIKSKDSKKILHLVLADIDTNGELGSFVFKVEAILDSTLYVNKAIMNFPEQLDKSMNIVLKASQILNSNIKEECNIIVRNDYTSNVIYGKNQIKFEYNDKNTVTLLSTTIKTQVKIEGQYGNITCENGLSDLDIIVPNIDGSGTICGNWPIIKTIDIEKQRLSNGLQLNSFYREPIIKGTFYFAANSFPLYRTTYNRFDFIPIETKTSIYLLSEYFDANISLKAVDDEEKYFYIDGIPIDTSENYRYILTNSSKLTVIATTRKELINVGPGKLIYKKIDNSWREVNTTLDLQKGGTIVLPYGFDFEECANKINEILNPYKDENPFPEEGNFSEKANYYIQFFKDKIADLSEIINNGANDIKPITINLIDGKESSGKKNNIVFTRKDIPLSYLYMNALNKLTKAVCINTGTIDITEWTTKDAANLIESFIDEDELEIEYYASRLIPLFKNSAIKGEIDLTENNKCIGFKQTEAPSSSIEIFVYTVNSTFIEILQKIQMVTVLTSDLDAASKLKNQNAKTIMIFVLDDLPNGKSINLQGIRKDANVFVVGFDQSKIDDIYQVIQTYHDLDNEYDYHPSDGWDSEEYHRLEEIKHKKQIELMTNLTSKYTKYQTKASINYDSVQTLVIASVNYVGTHIKCTNFYPLISTFENIKGIANDFSAKITVTESITYKLISSLPFKDLVIFPLSNNPINVMSIDDISFKEDQWILFLKAYLNDDGFQDNETQLYTIETNNIDGTLYLYSAGKSCNFTVPDTKENQKLKGVSIKFNSYDLESLYINDIPGIITFEDGPTNEKESNDKRVFGKAIKNIFSFIHPKSSNKKQINPLADEEEKSSGINFNGNWNKVESIDSLDIDVGNLQTIIEQIPTVLKKVIDIKSENSIDMGNVDDFSYSQPQTISKSKTISYRNENAKVTFSELIFTGSNPKLTLSLGGKASKIETDSLVVDSGTAAEIDGDLKVNNKLELGTGSSISAKSILSSNPSMKYNYRLESSIPQIPNGIDPSSITFSYIGESVGSTDVVDYSNYIGLTHNQLRITGDDHKNKCIKLKDGAKFESVSYPEFREKGKVVDVVCIDDKDFTILAINVTYTPTGEYEPPTEEPDDGNQPDDGNPSGGGSSNGGNKGLKPGEIAGIVVGVVAFVAIVAILIWYFVFHRKNKENGSQSSIEENEEK